MIQRFISRVFLRLLHKLMLRRQVLYINGSEALPPPLSKDEEAGLIRRLAQGDQGSDIRQALIERNIRLVVYIARKFDNTGIGLEDLISIGTIGLIKAVNTFDARKNIKLATYASRCIENEILMFLRRTTRLKTEISLDEPLNVDWDGNELLLSDILGTENDIVFREIETDVERTLVAEAVSQLPDRDKTIIRMRFGMAGFAEQTQKQVADALGISQSYISRLEKRIIRRLQKDVQKML
ncbi:MAG: RNA polymerase sporulation sigma factor SigE [Christensenellaceae bacterium]|nr:RNA polymerase sporulation sigma factor SigE [Christensenellaceae bacterium]